MNPLQCFRVQQTERTYEKQEVLEHFAAVFTVLDPQAFQDMFQAQMSMLYDNLMKEEAMITIPQHLLNQNTSRIFADILLKFLVKRIPDLSMNRFVLLLLKDDKKVTTNKEKEAERKNS